MIWQWECTPPPLCKYNELLPQHFKNLPPPHEVGCHRAQASGAQGSRPPSLPSPTDSELREPPAPGLAGVASLHRHEGVVKCRKTAPQCVLCPRWLALRSEVPGGMSSRDSVSRLSRVESTPE
jgi:hypothetical protein